MQLCQQVQHCICRQLSTLKLAVEVISETMLEETLETRLSVHSMTKHSYHGRMITRLLQTYHLPHHHKLGEYIYN
jgi:hypothetical protein